MGDKMESDESSCCRDMPMEVLIEVLHYLPVKSLIRFTCVCKSWLHLIKNEPRFAIRHYLARTTGSSRLMDNVDFIVDYFGKYGKGCRSMTDEEVLRLCMYSLTEKKTFRMVKKLEFGPGLIVSVSNICHGVLCIYVSAPDRGSRFVLCNPAIREVVPLPVSFNIKTHGLPVFGFGFDSINNDYKIMTAHPPTVWSGRSSWLVDVYSVRNGCWHSVHAVGPLEEYDSLEGEPVLNANGRILNWLGHHKPTTLKRLVSFDIVDEAFQATPLPECPHQKIWRKHLPLPSSQCQVCLCCAPYPSFGVIGDDYFNGIDIWVRNNPSVIGGNSDAGPNDDNQQHMWSKRVSFGFPDQEVVVWPSNIWMNDKEVFVYVKKKKGSTEEVFHYDLGTQQLKKTGRMGMLVNPDGYAESLVSIKRFMSSSCQEAAQDGSSDKDEKQKDDDGYVYFIREVGRRNSDVHWSYSFKLV